MLGPCRRPPGEGVSRQQCSCLGQGSDSNIAVPGRLQRGAGSTVCTSHSLGIAHFHHCGAHPHWLLCNACRLAGHLCSAIAKQNLKQRPGIVRKSTDVCLALIELEQAETVLVSPASMVILASYQALWLFELWTFPFHCIHCCHVACRSTLRLHMTTKRQKWLSQRLTSSQKHSGMQVDEAVVYQLYTPHVTAARMISLKI